MYTNGNKAKCRFQSECVIAVNLDASQCDLNLSKSACLSISTEGAYCKWNDGQCSSLNEEEI